MCVAVIQTMAYILFLSYGAGLPSLIYLLLSSGSHKLNDLRFGRKYGYLYKRYVSKSNIRMTNAEWRYLLCVCDSTEMYMTAHTDLLRQAEQYLSIIYSLHICSYEPQFYAWETLVMLRKVCAPHGICEPRDPKPCVHNCARRLIWPSWQWAFSLVRRNRGGTRVVLAMRNLPRIAACPSYCGHEIQACRYLFHSLDDIQKYLWTLQNMLVSAGISECHQEFVRSARWISFADAAICSGDVNITYLHHTPGDLGVGENCQHLCALLRDGYVHMHACMCMPHNFPGSFYSICWDSLGSPRTFAPVVFLSLPLHWYFKLHDRVGSAAKAQTILFLGCLGVMHPADGCNTHPLFFFTVAAL